MVVYAEKFQYISCYSLSKCPDSKCYSINVSIHLMLLFISNQCSESIRASTFQYISCYSLSLCDRTGRLVEDEFQYISCYSLSLYLLRIFLRPDVSIHLMLLFIHMSTYNGKSLECFNISHVTLYLNFKKVLTSWNEVSIHLMLLFIKQISNKNRRL